MNFRKVTNCRGCQSADLRPVFNLGNQPLANRFKLTSDEHEDKYPLEVLLCSKCSLAQLSIVVDPQILYGGEYAYVTDKGSTMTAHLEGLIRDFKPSIEGKRVLEIGSNDGHFLRMMIKSGASMAVGYEPCGMLALHSSELGSPTMAHVFNSETASLVDRKFDAVFARHVFAHVDDWQDFFKGLETITHEDSIVHIEVPYLLDQMKGLSFDQIYHEHLSYLSVSPFSRFISSIGWTITNINSYPIHGGSMVFSVSRSPNAFPFPEDVYDLVLDYRKAWNKFSDESKLAINNLESLIKRLHAEGKTIYGYGASAKSTVWLNAMDLPEGAIKAMCDSTPYKQGKVCPGTSIVVVPESELLLAQPDYAVIFAWNFSTEIMEKNKDFKGKWCIPIPELTLI